DGCGGITRKVASGSTRMCGNGDGGAVMCGEAALQLVDEHEVGQFRLPVSAGGAVGLKALQILEVNSRLETVGGAADCYDARVRRSQHMPQEQPGQREMPEMVGTKMHLKPIVGRCPRTP